METKMSGYGREDLILPEYKLVQNTGGKEARQAGAKPGQFYHTLRGDTVDEISCSIVDILKLRTRWGSEIADAPPLCSSADANSMVSVDNKDCKECPFRCDIPWSVAAGERREKCTIGFVLLGIDLKHDYEPFLLRAHGVSANAMRELLSALRFNRTLKGEYWQATICIKAVERETKQGGVFAIKAYTRGLLNPVQLSEIKDFLPQLVGISVAPALQVGSEDAELPTKDELPSFLGGERPFELGF